MIAFAAIDIAALIKVIWVSLLAGVGLTAIFCAVLYGSTRFLELRRDGRGAEALPFALLAVLAFAGVIAAVAAGFVAMISK